MGEVLGMWAGARFWTRWSRPASQVRGLRSDPRARHARTTSTRRARPKRRSMDAILLAPFRFIARLLSSDVKLERDGRNLHIRVAPKPQVDPDAAIKQAIAQAAPLRAALKALLDSHAPARRVMRHLGYVERALATQGLDVMSQVPVEVLAESLRQLESIVGNWSDSNLAELRSKLAVTVIERSRDPFGGPSIDRLSNFATESRMMVADVPHSMFLELERQYQGLVPQETIQAHLEMTKAS